MGVSTNRIVLLASVVVAVAGAGLLLLYKQRFEERAGGGAPVAVLMATRDIPAGTLLDSGMVGIRSIPESYVEGRHVRSEDAQRLVGVRINSDIKANESILWSDVATASPSRRHLSALVSSGMRAISVRADSTPAEAGLLRPGDRVDVILTTDKSGKKVTVPLLQNVLILAIGADTGAVHQRSRLSRRADKNLVTLSVTVPQAQLLTLSRDEGSMTLILRSPDDISVVDAPELTSRDLLAKKKHTTSTTRLVETGMESGHAPE